MNPAIKPEERPFWARAAVLPPALRSPRLPGAGTQAWASPPPRRFLSTRLRRVGCHIVHLACPLSCPFTDRVSGQLPTPVPSLLGQCLPEALYRT